MSERKNLNTQNVSLVIKTKPSMSLKTLATKGRNLPSLEKTFEKKWRL